MYGTVHFYRTSSILELDAARDDGCLHLLRKCHEPNSSYLTLQPCPRILTNSLVANTDSLTVINFLIHHISFYCKQIINSRIFFQKQKHLITHLVTKSVFSVCQSLSHFQFFVTPWTVALQSPLSMEFSRQESWSEQPFPFSWDHGYPEMEPVAQVSLLSEQLGKPKFIVALGNISRIQESRIVNLIQIRIHLQEERKTK